MFFSFLKATHAVEEGLEWISKNSRYEVILTCLIISVITHLISSLLLILGAMTENRSLLIPWLITDLVIVIIMAVIFISWTFLSFFVDILIVIIFPILAGTLLGLWIYSWRNVQDYYVISGLRCRYK